MSVHIKKKNQRFLIFFSLTRKIAKIQHMARKEDDGKLHVSAPRIILIFTGLFLVMDAIFYISFQHDQFWPFNLSFYIYTPILLGISGLFCYLTIHSTYYEIDKHKLVHTKLGQVKEYYWKDVIYINEKWSIKHKMMLFYMADGKERYLAFDKEGLIYEYALKYGHLISEEEFLARFPKARL